MTDNPFEQVMYRGGRPESQFETRSPVYATDDPSGARQYGNPQTVHVRFQNPLYHTHQVDEQGTALGSWRDQIEQRVGPDWGRSLGHDGIVYDWPNADPTNPWYTGNRWAISLQPGRIMRKQADLFGDSHPGETPQQEENWDAAAPGGVPWPDMDPAMWYRINGEDAQMASLPFKGAQPIYVHQGTAYAESDHPGLVEWAGDSGLKFAKRPQITLYRGIDLKRRSAEEIAAIHQNPLDFMRKGILGRHWTPDLATAQKFAGGQPGPEHMERWYQSEGKWPVGVVIEAQVPQEHIVQPHTDEWNALADSRNILPQGFGENESTVRRGAPMQITNLHVYSGNVAPGYSAIPMSMQRTAEYPGGGQMADKIKHQQDIEMFDRGDPDFQPEKVLPEWDEPRGPFACSQCDYKPRDIADYRLHVQMEHTPHDMEEIQDGHFPQIDDFDEPLPLRRTQPKPNSGETVAGVQKTPLYVIKLPDDRVCHQIPQFATYSKVAGFDTSTTVYLGAFEDGELMGYGVVREDTEPEVMMIQAKVPGRGVGTAIMNRIKRDYGAFYTHADTLDGERLASRSGMINVSGFRWRYAVGKDPKDMLENPVPFVFDIGNDRLVLGYPGYSTHDVTHPQGFTPGGIVEGTYEPGGKVTVWTASTHPWSVRHLLDLWKAQAPQMEVTSVEAKELDGSMSKLAGYETQNIGPYMNALVQSSPAAANAYRALSAAGGEVHVVGGAVRDYMRGQTPKDTDMLVRGLQPEEVLHTLRQLATRSGGGVKLTGERFGVYRYWSDKQGSDEVEIAIPRTDEYRGGSRADAHITVDPDLPIDKDLARRDFTANAMSVSLDDGKLHDPFNGAHDVQRGILRTTYPNSFRDDPSRLVRALTAAGRFGLVPDEKTRLEMRKHAHMLGHESPDTMQKVLKKWFEAPNPAHGVRLAHETGLLQHLFPQVERDWDFDQRNPYHNLPLGQHQVHTLDNMSRLTSDPNARLAALLHDGGKRDSQWVDDNGVGHYYKVDTKDPQTGEVIGSKGAYHESVGAPIAMSWLQKRYNWPKADTQYVGELVRRHMFPPFSDDVGARKFLNKQEPYADDLLHLRESDQEGKGLPGEEVAQRTPVDHMRQLVEQQREMGAPVQQAAMAINGNDVMSLGLKPGPAVGQILQFLTNAVVENPELNTREQLLGLAQQQIDALPLEARATA